MVLANKWVLKVLDVAPLFFLWLQMLIAVLLMALSQSIGFVNYSNTPGYKGYYAPISLWKAKKLWPLITINVVGLTFNTYCLAYIDASIYQVARSLILPLTVLFQFIFLKERSSGGVLFSCAIVCFGFLVGLFIDEQKAETIIDMRGIIFGFLSSITTALHSIVIKSSIDVCDGSTLELVWYNNVLSAIGLMPLVIFTGEIRSFSTWLAAKMNNHDTETLRILVFGTLLTGVFGFLINLAGFFQIKITSPVTHMISSAVRGVLQTMLAVWFFGDILTSSRVWGIFLILFGSSLYTWFKSQPQPSNTHPKIPV